MLSDANIGRFRRRVLMVGPAADGRGGIATVLRGYRTSALSAHVHLEFLVSHVEGSLVEKLLRGLSAFCDLAIRLIRRRPDIVHLHMASRGSFARKSTLAVLPRLARIPVVLHLHGGEFHLFNEAAPRPLRWWIRHTLEKADVVLALSDEWAAKLQTIAPRIRVAVVPNGVLVPSVPAHARHGHYVLFIGRLSESKGAHDLVRALAVADQTVRAMLVGDGARDGLVRLVASLGLGNRVEVHDWTDGEEKLRLIRSAAAFALPSYNEGLPMALLEAMAAGLPVVVTDVGGMPAVVSHGVSGIVVPPGDVDALARALDELWSDHEYRDRLGQAGREMVASGFSIDRSVERLLAVYTALLVTAP